MCGALQWDDSGLFESLWVRMGEARKDVIMVVVHLILDHSEEEDKAFFKSLDHGNRFSWRTQIP